MAGTGQALKILDIEGEVRRLLAIYSVVDLIRYSEAAALTEMSYLELQSSNRSPFARLIECSIICPPWVRLVSLDGRD